MVILRQATILYKGYDPEYLKPKSTKRICCSCDMCGRVRWIAKQAYRSIYHSLKSGQNMKEINDLAINYLLMG